MRRKGHYLSRKVHRYLGLFIGIQFFFWTIGGLYFSWTNIDDIHGDQFLQDSQGAVLSSALLGDSLNHHTDIQKISVRIIGQKPFLWINNKELVDPATWVVKDSLSQEEALSVAAMHVKPQYTVGKVEYITETDQHHEYRGRPLPAWVIHYEGDDQLTAYIGARDGSFQRVRHSAWRVFDFLWMLHTMDYEGRDDFNNWLLRAFSILGLVTISSGFILFYYSSPTLRKLRKRKRKKAVA